jgi:glycosyltransferase involved in cell wall biosynthesis
MPLYTLYYALKPLIPWQLRLALRRWRAKRRRAAYSDIWPIDEKAGTTPPSWPGWPEGKRFAVVLTHDVEGKKGVSRVNQLADLEAGHGFRSSFNFVPEGEYRLSDALRKSLDQANFEVGVHGLEHDGKLYRSKKAFFSKAHRIREYLAKWGASGFRSPLMQHNLSWLHELNAEYDASTFDTDPFEPQSDGVGTIFPFWVPGPNDRGYVELPYTLVQDFTLFRVLGEDTIDIWKQKVDWIAQRGGMVLLNTHPDYMWFGDSRRMRDEFPVARYEELLTYIKETYAGQYWSALPRDVARYYRETIPCDARNTRRKICMISHSKYESDNRVRRYAEALVKRGDQVDVLAIGWKSTPLGAEVLNGVTVHRLQHRERNERSKWDYFWRVVSFLMASSITLTRLHHKVRYDLIHIHNVPEFLVFAAWYPKLTGVKLILDIHDITPEFYASKFETKPDNAYVTCLKAVEKASCAFADHVIVSNHIWHQKLVARSVSNEKSSVFVNHVDPALFHLRAKSRNDGKTVFMYHGTFNWHQGLDIGIEAFRQVREKVGDAEFHIYGGGNRDELVEIVDRLGLADSIKFCGGFPLDQMPDVIANASIGVVPKRANSFGNEAYSTKIMEFMSQGIPVVVSRTKIDSYYFDDSVVRFFESGDSQSMAEAMLDVVENPALQKSLSAGGLRYAEEHGWSRKRKEYFAIIDALCTESFIDIRAKQELPARPAPNVEP